MCQMWVSSRNEDVSYGQVIHSIPSLQPHVGSAPHNEPTSGITQTPTRNPSFESTLTGTTLVSPGTPPRRNTGLFRPHENESFGDLHATWASIGYFV